MSLTMSQGDGMTVISVTTNPKSKWPLLCQILGTLCYSPVCSVAQKPKRKLTNTQTALGFLAVGIVCNLAAKFPSPCLLVITVILNIVSAGLAIAAVVLYSMDVAVGSYLWCNDNDYYSTPSPEQRRNTEACQYYKHLNQMILGGLDIMMIALAVLQLCVTISFCVVTLKALCEKSGAAKSVEDPQLYKPLLEDAAADPPC
ncbi:hypothetical protein E1301_Tti024135 [Triplophysa tibetana]|uniref:Uncharacterized protein n=1 Tax=Triplophysa tibetana TaxID=1572043 RepID=A0A5A9MZF2_9TELE|nr:hypothetical protein E1301_Tti011207 [Triplophysa tibetana]KAA0702750.1 hypothetical protein E1301_Tti024135 [Triplophysa tibetana]